MHSTIAGPLTPDRHGCFFESAPLAIPYFDGRLLPVVFEEDEPAFLAEADRVLAAFLTLGRADRLTDSSAVYRYYEQVLAAGGRTGRPLIEREEDLWSHVTPESVMINWDETGQLYVCVDCACAWEEEHGLYLVFKDGEKLTRAAGFDGYYTDEAAAGG
jgi:hypothetical protein